ncbi:MAG: tyrosine--tRNA ligase [Phycisphaerales bacterium]
MGFLSELNWRGLVHQTAGDELDAFLKTPGRAAYAGFDPTGDSLTIGNFIPIKMLMHWQRAGHTPIVVMGGGTGLIGDPSGKEAERQLRTREEIDHNINAQRRIYERFLNFEGENAATIVNNIDWLQPLGYIEMLRDIGKHFSINMMVQKESVAERLNNREQGISYTEFSYMILQAYDFLHLKREYNCAVQLGGSDQFGNIVAGMDLIRRTGHNEEEKQSFAITCPLVTRADGGKIGKTETGAVWLTADRTSPYMFYQYWINADDRDVEQFLKWFTMMPRDQIEAVVVEHKRSPELRSAQRALAEHMTTLVHGHDEMRRVEAASEALFSGDVRALDRDLLAEVFADVPSSTHARAGLEGDGMALLELLPLTSLASSKREAREFLGNGAISINGEKASGIDHALQTTDLLHGNMILLRRGKKAWHALQFDG